MVLGLPAPEAPSWSTLASTSNPSVNPILIVRKVKWRADSSATTALWRSENHHSEFELVDLHVMYIHHVRGNYSGISLLCQHTVGAARSVS